MKTINTLAPLTPAVFYILLALASGEKHGYEIMKQVKQDSQSQVKMGTGTLYGSLKRMLAARLIEEAGSLPAPQAGLPDSTHSDERRRYYRLTELGRRAFTTELQRYSQVVSIAQQRSLLPNFSLEPGL
jgi:DNA-binding PadR family transcriptional regulator